MKALAWFIHVFDWKIIIGICWTFTGMMIIGLTFTLPDMNGGVMGVYALVAVLWIGTAEKTSAWLTS